MCPFPLISSQHPTEAGSTRCSHPAGREAPREPLFFWHTAMHLTFGCPFNSSRWHYSHLPWTQFQERHRGARLTLILLGDTYSIWFISGVNIQLSASCLIVRKLQQQCCVVTTGAPKRRQGRWGTPVVDAPEHPVMRQPAATDVALPIPSPPFLAFNHHCSYKKQCWGLTPGIPSITLLWLSHCF